MKLTLYRTIFGPRSTIGELFLDGGFLCYTLEDVVRPEKIKGETAIPAGLYAVDITYSPRFARMLPLLLAVPDFEGVRIHPGNRPEDTEGCILVGTQAGVDVVTNSRVAFDQLFGLMVHARNSGESIRIEIIDGARI